MLHKAEMLLQELIAYVRKAELQQDILSRYELSLRPTRGTSPPDPHR